jgi:hypothetical protein
MYRLLGLILAGGLVLGQAASARAQVSVSVGNPYTGTGFSLTTPGYPYGLYGYGANAYSYPYGTSSVYSSYYPGSVLGTTYSSGYSGYVAPRTTYFGTGYAAPAYGYGYSSYGWPAYSTTTYYGAYPYYGVGRRGLLRGWRRGGWWW